MLVKFVGFEIVENKVVEIVMVYEIIQMMVSCFEKSDKMIVVGGDVGVVVDEVVMFGFFDDVKI